MKNYDLDLNIMREEYEKQISQLTSDLVGARVFSRTLERELERAEKHAQQLEDVIKKQQAKLDKYEPQETEKSPELEVIEG